MGWEISGEQYDRLVSREGEERGNVHTQVTHGEEGGGGVRAGVGVGAWAGVGEEGVGVGAVLSSTQ